MLSAVGASMIATGRNDLALARNLRASAIAMAAADGAIQVAGFHVLPCTGQSDCAPWPTNGRPVDASRDGVGIAVCMTDDAGKINPNQSNSALLAALLAAVGVPPTESGRLAEAIVAWRTAEPNPAAAADRVAQYRQAGLPYAPDGQKFTGIDDLQYVMGMTPAILERLRPNLSIWNAGDPDPALATPATRLALQNLLGASAETLLSLGTAINGAQPRTIAITATATIPRGAQFSRAAVISLERDPAKAPVRILSWAAAAQPCL